MNSNPSKTSSILVADTGPLLALARINQLQLLGKLFKECRVTASVVEECLAKPECKDAAVIQGALNSGVLVAISDPKINPNLSKLDCGEQSAIEAASKSNCILLIDEKRGRTLARSLGIQIIGTLGILLLAKKRGLIPETKTHIQLLEEDYYFSKTLINTALELANE